MPHPLPCKPPLPLPLGEVAERSEDGEGKLGCNALSVTPWGERPAGLSGWSLTRRFQSTLPVGGSTGVYQQDVRRQSDFNPRSPWGDRPLSEASQKGATPISIHAPRGGIDPAQTGALPGGSHFNPRSPWGDRPRSSCSPRRHYPFQSTLPVGGSTGNGGHVLSAVWHFNPRSPWGDRRLRLPAYTYRQYFNPRSPWGDRQQRCTDFSVNLWQKCIFSECFLRKSPGYSGWIFGKPLFLPQKFLRTSREFLGALASHGGRLTISQRISVSSGR